MVHTPVHSKSANFWASPLAASGRGTINRVVCAHGVHRAYCRAWCGVCMVVAVSDLSEFLANEKGDRSIDAIADKATAAGHRIGRSVVAKYLRGEHGPRIPEATLTGLAAGFGVDVRELRRLAGRPPGELGPYVPTAESSSLTQPQRNALDQLIKAFVSEGGPHGLVDSAQKSTKASVTPAGNPPVDYAWSNELDIVTPITPQGEGEEPLPVMSPDDVTLAARRTRSHGKQLQAEADARGEESQDDGGMDPV